MKKLRSCPVDAFLQIVGQRWSSYILWILLENGPTRFGELKKRMAPISHKILTEKLRELEETKIVHRDSSVLSPPMVVLYSITDLGKTLIPWLQAMSDIAHDWRKRGFL